MLPKVLHSPMIKPTVGIALFSLLITCPLTSMAEVPAVKANSLLAYANGQYPEKAYTLGAGDRLSIDILKIPQYSGESEVLVNGTLNLPQVGSVSVQGMTLEQAAAAIAAKYASILRNPRVTVNLLAPRPLKIGIAGEVDRPGSYTLTLEGSQFPTVTRALEMAGGITQAADLRQVKVRRPQSSGSEQVITVNLWQLLQTGNLSHDLKLRDGDTIFVPTTSQISLEEGPQIAAASFSVVPTQPLNIAVLGEVREPGPHTITPQAGSGGLPTVTQAIQIAGGINPLADVQRIQIRRSTKNGSSQTIEVDLLQLLNSADLRQDLILQHGDTVFIPTMSEMNLAQASQLQNVSFAPDEVEPLNVTVVGEVFRPGSHTVTGSVKTGEAGVPGGTNGAGSLPTVTRAIQVAGGIQPSADVRQIQIRRTTSSGTKRTIEVNLWELLQQGDSSQDPILQDGDTIFVPTATALDPAEASQIATASFSPNTIRVNVVGEVEQPGVVEVPPNTPLNQALLAAGGFNNRASDETVQLVRLNPNGTVARQEVPIDFAQGVNQETNPTLSNNDVIIVGRSTLAGVSDTLDTAVSPLGKFLTILSFPFKLFGLF